MFVLDGSTVVLSPSDLTTASTCEFDFARRLDARLGWGPPVPKQDDPMYLRSSALGDEHELRVLEEYAAEHGDALMRFERPRGVSTAALQELATATRRAFESGASVVYQGVFFHLDDEAVPAPRHARIAERPVDDSTPWRLGFVGYADFIVREPDGRYRVEDTKLARRAKVTALLQVAAYALELRRIGITPSPTVRLLLGDRSVSEHALEDILPVYLKRIARLHATVREHLADGAMVEWGDERFAACGRCDTCAAEVETHRDVLLVAGVRVAQRARFVAAGIRTIDDLAGSGDGLVVEGVQPATLRALREQARLQVSATPGAPPPVRIYNPQSLAGLPLPDEGDLFFDFEGDPLHGEPQAPGVWGLDYLFGVLDTAGTFTPFWAHSFAEERRALLRFLEFVARRRAEHPGMHIYHYASYERTHLLSLAARHGVGEREVDDLLRASVLVDLYPLVKKAVRVGSRSYSIKKLEPLYMGDELREAEVQNGADSITAYVTARELIAAGDVPFDEASSRTARQEGERMLADLADYNRYDVVSTLRLRDWLLARAADAGVRIGAPAPGGDTVPPLEPSTLRDELLARAGEPRRPGETSADRSRVRSDDETAAALAAAALDYHAREQKSFWWAHFARLVEPVESWANTRDVFLVADAVVLREWSREGKERQPHRELLLRGAWAPGSTPRPGGRVFALYEYPGPYPARYGDPGSRTAAEVTVADVTDEGVLVVESLPDGRGPFDDVPTALTPGSPPPPGRQVQAIETWCRTIVDAAPDWPRDPVTDLLRRVPPRTVGLSVAERVTEASADSQIAAVTDAVASLDRSYLAVQGPPGTGKTYLGAHVIASLVRDRHWKIGVVAQSHATVEHLLDAIVTGAGLDGSLVGKVPQGSKGEEAREAAERWPFTALEDRELLAFPLDHADSGFVLGGTAWTFSNPARVASGSLDLLVIDEAGQYSLASTAAVAVASSRLLLLGDPQQLPQVSQGIHPEPVDRSALGWISAGHDVLPAEWGFFLPETRRLHPALADAVSRLSYEGRLRAHPSAGERMLDGIRAGVHPVPVVHAGDATESVDEAAEVVWIVREVLGRAWTDPTSWRPAPLTEDRAARVGASRPLDQEDVIVVTAYNAQLNLVRDALERHGLAGVRVGTVDRFQGREAVVAIVSLAASSALTAPRGLGFLLMKNRLNVAISRAQWAAYVVSSPELTESLPHTAEEVAELSAFIRLVEP